MTHLRQVRQGCNCTASRTFDAAPASIAYGGAAVAAAMVIAIVMVRAPSMAMPAAARWLETRAATGSQTPCTARGTHMGKATVVTGTVVAVPVVPAPVDTCGRPSVPAELHAAITIVGDLVVVVVVVVVARVRAKPEMAVGHCTCPS